MFNLPPLHLIMTCLPQALLKSAVFVYAADLGFKAKPINLNFMTRIYIQPLCFTFLLCVLRFSFVFYVSEKNGHAKVLCLSRSGLVATALLEQAASGRDIATSTDWTQPNKIPQSTPSIDDQLACQLAIAHFSELGSVELRTSPRSSG